MTRLAPARGFTLLELAIVLLALGLVLAGGLGPLAARLEARDRAATQAALEAARDALLGFAAARGRLPCPDADGDGRADPPFDPGRKASATCTRAAGRLPWVELGVAGTDAWGGALGYVVAAPRFTWPDSDGLCNGNTAQELDLCAQGTLVVRTRGDDPQTQGVLEGKAELVMADGVPALLLSSGRNGGLSGPDGGAQPAPAGTDERDNQDGDARFVLRGPARGEPACRDGPDEAVPLCTFDDQGLWLSLALLQERLIAARRLP
mgnify:CR=1 FL=1